MTEQTQDATRSQEPPKGKEDNLAEVTRRGRRRSTGQDTPSGPKTERTVKRAKREQAQEAKEQPGPS